MTTAKKKFLICTAIVLALSVTVVAVVISRTDSKPPVRYTEVDGVAWSDEEVMARATHIVDAVYVGEYVTDYGTELMFEPVKTFKGDLNIADDTRIYVQPIPKSSDGQDEAVYTQNKTYMLFLEKNSSVYYEHDKYVQLGGLFVSSEDSKWTEYHTKASAVAKRKNTAPSSYGIPYTDSTELEAVINASENIFVVKIESVYAESDIAPTTVYNARVLQTIKNTPAREGNILITLFNDTVTVGGEYLVLLADATETAPVYTLSSRENSVYGISDAQEIPELESLLGQAEEYTAGNSVKSDEELLEEEQNARNTN